MACVKTTFQKYVTRVTADWLNSVDALLVAIGCATTKDEVQVNLDIVPRDEYQTQVNLLQSQINTLNAQIEVLEACLDGYCIRVVTALPATPDPNVIYHVTG